MKQQQPKVNIPVDGKKLRALRGKLTQREVEVRAGLPYGRLTQYEKGRCDVPPDHLEKLLTFYKVEGRTVLTKQGYTQIHTTIAQLARIMSVEVKASDFRTA